MLMKVLAALFLLLTCAQCKILLPIKNIDKPYEFKRAVLPNQICKGSFRLITDTKGSIDITIFAENGKRVFYKTDMHSRDSVDFSFNTTESQTYHVKIEQNQVISEKEILLEYEFTSQCNTFNKNVAKAQVLGPAMEETYRIEKLLHELAMQTSLRQRDTQEFTNNMSDIIISIPCINFIVFLAFAGILGYQMISFKDFLKKKKLI